jgi:cell wall-associated NlpC family hydrolase
MLVNEPFVNVWLGRQEVLGPYEYPLVPSGRAVGLYSQACYGELIDKQEAGDGLVAVQVPGQLRFSLQAQGVGAIPGFCRAASLTKNDDLLRLQPLVVTADSAVVYKRPGARTRGSALIDVPFGSILRLTELSDDDVWLPVMLHDKAVGYVEQAAVSRYDEVLLSNDRLHQAVAQYARRFVTMPYNLGGRTLFKKRENMLLSSVDCSGLVFLAYHANGLFIPKISHAQFLFSSERDPALMQPGDLIFFKRKSKEFTLVSHVVMYLGEGMLIESTGLQSSSQQVRIISVEDYFGAPLDELTQGCEVLKNNPEAHARIFFRTYLPSTEAAEVLRRKFLAVMRGDFAVLLD